MTAPRRSTRHDEKVTVTRDDLDAALAALELGARAVCVHSSLRSFGQVDAGADAIIDAVLDAGCTLLVPTHSWGFATSHQRGMRPSRNGWDYAMNVAPPAFSGVFSVDSTAVDRNMGAIPRAVLQRPGHQRGNHPLASFSAIGPLATQLVGGQRGDDVHAPLRELAERDGAVVMMGVGLTRMTLLHWAEQVAGRAQFRRWALDERGDTVMVESGGCSEGFDRLASTLAPVETDVRVGASEWRCFPAAEVVARAAAAIRADPNITHCNVRTCARCNDAALGGPIT
jgi:aminoglycoside 3-N-acetyltransferase